MSNRRTLILPIGAGVIGMDDVPLVRIMDSDETPTSITAYGVVDTVQPVLSVTWTVNGVEQEGDVTKSPVLELTDLQPETSYAITLRATNLNGESQAATKTIWTKKITTITPADVVDGVTYYDYQDVYRTGTMPEMDETDITVSGRDVTVPAGHYADTETVSVSSEYIIPTGTKNINANGTDDVTQYASVNVNVPASAVDTGTKQTNITTNGTQTFDVVGYANNEVTVNVQPNLETANVTPSTSPQTIVPTGNVDGYDRINVSAVTGAIDPNITPSNIKDGVTILGVTGEFGPTPDLGTLNVTPSTSAQTITPSGLDGWDEVDVAPVSSNIDANIQAGNIKDGVTILGVTGTLQEGITPTGTLNIINNGTYNVTNYASVFINVASGNFDELCFTALQSNSKVGMSHTGTNTTTTKPVMYYSTDGRQTWNLWDYSDITLANVDDKVYFYGDNIDGFSKSEYDYSIFTLSGQLSVSGKIMSLITRYGDRDIPNAHCFRELFKKAGALKDAQNLVLPSNTTDSCYQSMFWMTGITVAPNLPAETVTKRSYMQMFQHCGSLTTIQSFGMKRFDTSSSADSACCNNMFSECGSLVNIPDVLEPTELAPDCYYYMFRNCGSITKAPMLPAKNTTNERNVYYGMFDGCSSLNNITTLASSLNQSNWVRNVAQTGTFYKIKGADIPIDSPNGVPVGWTVVEIPSVIDNNNEISFDYNTGTNIYYTLDGTTPTTSSTLYTEPIDALIVGNKFTLKYLAVYNGVNLPIMEYGYYNAFYIEALENNTVLDVDNWRDNMLYSTDKQTWAKCDTATNRQITLTNTGDKVYFKKATVDGVRLDVGALYTVSGTIKAGGFLEYAATGDITNNATLTFKVGNLFENCTGMVDASDLILIDDMTGYNPGYTSNNGAYAKMFCGCTNLVKTPNLPSQQLGLYCYFEMFKGCTSLTKCPDLPATTLGERSSYQEMFMNCTSLTTSGKIMATSIRNFYSTKDMFNGCTNLSRVFIENCTDWEATYGTPNWLANVAPVGTLVKPASLVIGTGRGEIPADSPNGIPVGWTAIEPIDPNMLRFTANQANSTIRLVKVNKFPIEIKLYTSTDGTNFTQWDGSTITLANVNDKLYMYGDNAYFAYATRLDACNSFSLNGDISVDGDITNLLTRGGTNTVPAYCFYRLFQGASGLTSAPELPATTLGVSCYEAMFVNCVNLTTAPSTLPATTLAERCYNSMFGDCTSLTTAPELPANTLADGCYNSMFYNCSNLNSITCMATDISAVNCTSVWVANVAQTGTFRKNSQMSNWTTGDDGIPTGWTVVNA